MNVRRIAALSLLIPLAASAYTLEFGLLTTVYDYTELNGTAVLDTERSHLGDIGGGYLGLDVPLRDNGLGGQDSVTLYGSHTKGTTRYKGSLLGSDMPYGSFVSTTADTFDDIRLGLSRTFPMYGLDYTLEAGIGYQRWKRELSSTQKETYEWHYLRVGAGMAETFYRDWTLAVEFDGKYAFVKEMEARLEGMQPLTFALGRSFSLSAGIPVTIPLRDTLALVLRLGFEFARMSRSDTVSAYYPPEDTVKQWYEPESEQQNWHFGAGLVMEF